MVFVPSKSLLDLLYLGGPVELTDTTTTVLPMVGCRTPPRLRTTCETSSTGWGEPKGAHITVKRAKLLNSRVFSMTSFNDQEIVALSGAHAMGRCHTG